MSNKNLTITSKDSKKKWILTSEDFSLLLSSLDPDPAVGAERYELIRRKLIRFFRAKGAAEPESSADEVFDRACRRLSEGAVELDVEKPIGYFLQIANFVFLEECRRMKNKLTSLEDLPPGFEPSEDPVKIYELMRRRIEKENGLEALAKCRQELTESERLMVDSYNLGSGHERIARRAALAEKLGKTLNSLRIDVFRVNSKLKRCAEKSLRFLWDDRS